MQSPLTVDGTPKCSVNEVISIKPYWRWERVNKEVSRNQIPWHGWALQFLWRGDLSMCFTESGSWRTQSSLNTTGELFAVVTCHYHYCSNYEIFREPAETEMKRLFNVSEFYRMATRQIIQGVLCTSWGSKVHYSPLQAVPRGKTDSSS